MILSGLARQVKGLASLWLWFSMKLVMAVSSSLTDWKTPCFNLRRVSLAKKPSTALRHELDVGMKWKVQRGWRASQVLTLACLWVQ